jgi:hypothetical protein
MLRDAIIPVSIAGHLAPPELGQDRIQIAARLFGRNSPQHVVAAEPDQDRDPACGSARRA